MSFQGKVILLTGAASGIGLATAKLLASAGAKLSLADVQEEKLSALADELQKDFNADVQVAVVDIRKRSEVSQWVRQSVDALGKIDGAAHVAGVTGNNNKPQGVAEIQDDDWDWVFDINVKGTLHCLREEVPYLNDGASIVNFASLVGLVGIPNNATYAASKHAVIGLTRSVAKELGPRNIRVNAVCPGVIETPLIAANRVHFPALDAFSKFNALGRSGKPEEAAYLVEWLLSPHSSYVTGTSQVIDGGFHCQ